MMKEEKRQTMFVCSVVEADYWSDIFFGVGYEVMFLKMDDGELIEYLAYAKAIPDKNDLHKILKTKGYTLSQARVAIHSHEYRPDFSAKDRLFYQELKKDGFRGAYQLYCRGVVAEYRRGE